jgi:hypothetical protein
MAIADGPGMPTFGAFNHAGPTVEWRMAQVGGRPVPVAAIQRLHLANGNGGRSTQTLVVSKVGQPADRAACMMGYVSDHDGAAANRRARRIADGAATHDCAHDCPVVEPSAAQVPPR